MESSALEKKILHGIQLYLMCVLLFSNPTGLRIYSRCRALLGLYRHRLYSMPSQTEAKL